MEPIPSSDAGNGMSLQDRPGRPVASKWPSGSIPPGRDERRRLRPRPDPKKFGKSGRLTLKPWGTIRAGRGSDASRRETGHKHPAPGRATPRPADVHTFDSIETQTDLQGNFSFDRVIPGPPGGGQVWRVLSLRSLAMEKTQHMECWQEPVDVAPGRTVLGAHWRTWRTVVGRVVCRRHPASGR